jgi:hypothetical protein
LAERVGEGNEENAIGAFRDLLLEERKDFLEQARQAGADVSIITGSRVNFSEFNRPIRGTAISDTMEDDNLKGRQARAAERMNRSKRKAREDRQGMQLRFSLSATEAAAIDGAPTETQRRAKLAQVMHDADKSAEKKGLSLAMSIIREQVSKGFKSAILSGSPLRNLGDFIRTYNDGHSSGMQTGLQKYLLETDKMGATFNKYVKEYTAELDPWVVFHRKDPDAAGVMHGVMHEATLARTDPAETYIAEWDIDQLELGAEGLRARIEKVGRNSTEGIIAMRRLEQAVARIEGEKARKLDHARLAATFNALPEEARGKRLADGTLDPENRGIYRNIRDQYAAMDDEQYTKLIEKIEELAKDNENIRTSLDEVRKTFETKTIGAPYFPLARFGDYWAVAKDEDGNVMGFSQFERQHDGKRKQWVKAMRERGYEVTVGTGSSFENSTAMAGAVDAFFAKNVIAKLAAVPGGQRMADDVWQMYLMRLPEMSARKSRIHRKGIPGFTSDALRSYAHHSFKTARALAKTIHGHRIDTLLEEVHEGAKQLTAESDGAATWAMPIYEELKLRHEWQMNPKAQPVSSFLVRMGFHAFLGFNISSMIVNLTQPWIVGVPVLGAKYGVDNATRELFKASNDMRHSQENWKDYLTDDELEAMLELENMGVFDKGRAYELMGMADSGEAYVGSALQRLEQGSAWMFSNAERFNRELTALAAYRLARDANVGSPTQFEDAHRAAWKLTWDTHFDYSNANRPRVMQNAAGRVFLLFRNYGFNMAYRVGKDLVDVLNQQEMDPKQKREAKVRLAGMMGATFMFAGTKALPMVGVVGTGLLWAFGDDDDPIDMWDSIRLYLNDMIGEDATDMVMEGPVSALTGIDVSQRLSLSNLFFRDAPPEAELFTGEWYSHYAGQAMGPLGSYMNDLRRGGSAVLENESDEKLWRGIELMLPTQMRNMAKSGRYFLEDGAKSWAGSPILEKGEDIAAWRKVVQAAGFSPYELNRRYEEIGAISGLESRLIDRRSELIDRKVAALLNKDRDRLQTVNEEIKEWNLTQRQEKRAQFRITGGDINRSRRAKRRANREVLGGRRFSARGRALAEQRGLKR